jgi:hypothetical protein
MHQIKSNVIKKYIKKKLKLELTKENNKFWVNFKHGKKILEKGEFFFSINSWFKNAILKTIELFAIWHFKWKNLITK